MAGSSNLTTGLVACLLLVVAQQTFAYEENKSAVNGLRSLNRFLTRELDPEASPEKCVASANKKLNQPSSILDWNTKPAIKALAAISSANDQCEDKTLKAIHYVATGGLNVRSGEQRVEKVLRHFLQKNARGCEPFVAQQLESLMSKLDKSKLDQVLAARTDKDIVQSLSSSSESQDEVYAALICDGTSEDKQHAFYERIFQDLIDFTTKNKDPVAAKLTSSEDDKSKERRASVRNAFNKYLREPCKYYISNVSSLFDKIFAFAQLNLGHDSAERYLMTQPKQFQDALYHYKRCQAILTMDNKSVDGLKKGAGH